MSSKEAGMKTAVLDGKA